MNARQASNTGTSIFYFHVYANGDVFLLADSSSGGLITDFAELKKELSQFQQTDGVVRYSIDELGAELPEFVQQILELVDQTGLEKEHVSYPLPEAYGFTRSFFPYVYDAIEAAETDVRGLSQLVSDEAVFLLSLEKESDEYRESKQRLGEFKEKLNFATRALSKLREFERHFCINDELHLPVFKYFPNPIESGAVEPSSQVCACCEQPRGYICGPPIWSEEPVEGICPWCVADGSAAHKFSGYFSELEASVPEEVEEEVCKRTPGLPVWQETNWRVHCGDACEYLGDVSKDELEALSEDKVKEILETLEIDAEDWQSIVKDYEPGGDCSIHKFRCRMCAHTIYILDLS